MPVVEPLTRKDLPVVSRLLTELALPDDDLDHSDNRFFGIFEAHRLIACGGLQAAGTAVLLRSLAVLPTSQGQGLGRQLVDFILQEATLSGFEAVYLLTETSGNYFASLGFRQVQRNSAPEAIAATAQFTALCPDSAVCLMKVLRSA